MLQSIVVYSLMSIILYLGFKRKPMINHDFVRLTKGYSYLIPTIFAYTIFAVVSGVRWDVGFDHLSYLKSYLQIHLYDDGMEKGFVALIKFCNYLNLPFYVFFAFIAFLQLFFATKFYRYRQYLVAFFACLIILSGEYFSWMNGIRQQLVACVFLYLIPYCIIPRKKFLFIFIILICSLFHRSSLLLLPFYFLTYLRHDKSLLKPSWQLILLILSFAISSIGILDNVIYYIDPFLNFLGYGEKYSAEYLMSLENAGISFGPRRMMLLFIDIIIIVYSTKLQRVYCNKDFKIAYVLYFIMLIFQTIFINSQLFLRLFSYFTIFRPVVVSYLLYYLINIQGNNKNKLIAFVIIILYALRLLADIYTDMGNHTSCIRYQFFFNKI